MKKQFFFVGIKGVGMASLAILCKQLGYEVEGSDVAQEFITDELLHKEKIILHKGFEENVVDKLPSSTLVIYTGAHGGITNPQVKKALEKELKCITYGEVLGQFMEGSIINRQNQIGISVSGAHGKTTVSAMVASYLSLLGGDPSYVIGTSEVFPIGAGGHGGKGKYFVAEADEYVTDPKNDRTPKLLFQHPQYAVLNNIDFDHPDVFKNIEDIEETFEKFIEGMSEGGTVIINGDDNRLLTIKKKYEGKIRFVTAGAGEHNDYKFERYHESGFNSFFTVVSQGFALGEFSLSVPGYHNAKNASLVIALLIELGFTPPKIQEVLPGFKGTKRRLERVGQTRNGVEVLDDYAHHPEEIKASLNAIKGAYPGKHILCIFQSHTVSRTRSLLSEFTTAFTLADTLIVLPVFSSAREEQDRTIEEEFKAQFQAISKKALFLKTQDDAIQYIHEHVTRPDTVIVTMGAGDVYQIGEQITGHK